MDFRGLCALIRSTLPSILGHPVVFGALTVTMDLVTGRPSFTAAEIFGYQVLLPYMLQFERSARPLS
jgi:trimethylamine:corrinoid methyltransferase-like protein